MKPQWIRDEEGRLANDQRCYTVAVADLQAERIMDLRGTIARLLLSCVASHDKIENLKTQLAEVQEQLSREGEMP